MSTPTTSSIAAKPASTATTTSTAAAAAADDTAIRHVPIAIPQADLDDLTRRLAATRWPDAQPVSGEQEWSQGSPLAAVQSLCEYWQRSYEWRRCERLLNGWQQQHTSIDGLAISFYHIRSPHAAALPLLLTHGWPGSVLEFRHCVQPLTDPPSPADAFHLVLPSLPGYAFSGKPTEVGWNDARTARAWAELMRRLGYTRWVAQGGDWGARVTTRLGQQAPAGLLAIHVNDLFFDPEQEMSSILPASADEREAARVRKEFAEKGRGYGLQQGTRPQALGYGLADSPAGQLAWIYDKLHDWTDRRAVAAAKADSAADSAGESEGEGMVAVEAVLSRDDMLDNAMLYWLTNSATSSARYYWENGAQSNAYRIDIPVCVSQFPHNPIQRTPRKWAERYYRDLRYWNEMDKGGHFAAWEQPELFVAEMREAFRPFR